ncbi:hypothetical protein ZIOFF_070615 [Zingiber officinale]|uniref:Uncharacterized protein n=1 Tax=Zingiber officinale TaxID=94328 RepID=A0A8J5BZC6_ZINOF|nr:hypothetical protein ZIOFF_070615 [Zingiber officinale]
MGAEVSRESMGGRIFWLARICCTFRGYLLGKAVGEQNSRGMKLFKMEIFALLCRPHAFNGSNLILPLDVDADVVARAVTRVDVDAVTRAVAIVDADAVARAAARVVVDAVARAAIGVTALQHAPFSLVALAAGAAAGAIARCLLTHADVHLCRLTHWPLVAFSSAEEVVAESPLSSPSPHTMNTPPPSITTPPPSLIGSPPSLT